jgi:hypothetical protein
MSIKKREPRKWLETPSIRNFLLRARKVAGTSLRRGEGAALQLKFRDSVKEE